MCELLSLVFIDDFNIAKNFFPQETCPFTNTTEKKLIADHMITLYKKEATKFLNNAHASCLTNKVQGDGETFYIHALSMYIPKIMRETYDSHMLGLGVFTMEGFEYKNYSSKHAIREHSNRKGNVCLQSLKYLTLQFINRKHEVTKEIKKRKFRMNDRSKIKAKRKLIETTDR